MPRAVMQFVKSSLVTILAFAGMGILFPCRSRGTVHGPRETILWPRVPSWCTGSTSGGRREGQGDASDANRRFHTWNAIFCEDRRAYDLIQRRDHATGNETGGDNVNIPLPIRYTSLTVKEGLGWLKLSATH